MLEIMIENQGRIIDGHMNDPKGLISNVTLDGVVLTNWTVSHLKDPPDVYHELKNDLFGANNQVPAFFKGIVPSMPEGLSPQDTYLSLHGWEKVVLYSECVFVHVIRSMKVFTESH